MLSTIAQETIPMAEVNAALRTPSAADKDYIRDFFNEVDDAPREWKDEIRRRIELVRSGNATFLTLEDVMANTLPAGSAKSDDGD